MTVHELIERLWDLEFLSCGRPPRPLGAGSLFAAAIAAVAEDRVELAAALVTEGSGKL